MMRRRVVVTGLGMISPCGKGWQPYWKTLAEGQSAVRAVRNFSANGFSPKFAGEITDFDAGEFVKQRKSLKVMSREIQLAIAASQLALQDAGIDPARVNTDAFGVCLGTGIINNDLDEVGIGIRNAIDERGAFDIRKFGQQGIRALFPLWFLKYLPNMPACHISIAHGLKGPSNAMTTSSAAGAHAIGEAFRIIERGDAECMLAGGTDSKLNAMGISRFYLLGLLSARAGSGEHPYAPFDRRHDGIVVGEGAGLILLESLDHARARGAEIYAEVCGYGSSADYNRHPRHPQDTSGKCAAMSRAVADAGLGPSDIDFVLANGSGIPGEDILEAQAIRTVFTGELDRIRVSGVKPATGHLVYGSAGVEAIAAVLALRYQTVPPLLNFEAPDPECLLPFVTRQAQSGKIRSVLFNSFGFGGQNASLTLKFFCG